MTTATQAHITFYFPKLANGKNEEKYHWRRNIKNIPINPLAKKLQCKQCKTFYYNARFEEEFQRCRDHNPYHYSKTNMIIRHRGQDLNGKYWTSHEVYQNVGSARFMFYNPPQVGTRTLTCLTCTKYQHDINKLLHHNQSQQLYINDRERF